MMSILENNTTLLRFILLDIPGGEIESLISMAVSLGREECFEIMSSVSPTHRLVKYYLKGVFREIIVREMQRRGEVSRFCHETVINIEKSYDKFYVLGRMVSLCPSVRGLISNVLKPRAQFYLRYSIYAADPHEDYLLVEISNLNGGGERNVCVSKLLNLIDTISEETQILISEIEPKMVKNILKFRPGLINVNLIVDSFIENENPNIVYFKRYVGEEVLAHLVEFRHHTEKSAFYVIKKFEVDLHRVLNYPLWVAITRSLKLVLYLSCGYILDLLRLSYKTSLTENQFEEVLDLFKPFLERVSPSRIEKIKAKISTFDEEISSKIRSRLN